MTNRARRRFRPTLWGTIVVIPMLAVLIGLGMWQLERMAWKEALIDTMHTRVAAPAIALPVDLSDGETLHFRRIVVAGEFLHDREIHRVARTHRERHGFHLVTAMRLDDGREVLVNRGWLPIEMRDPDARPETLVEGPVRLEAIARLGGWSGVRWLRPENDSGSNDWLWMDLEAMAARAELSNPVTEIYLDAAESTAPGAYPIAGQTRVDLPNNHLGYAITWFSIALGLAAIYLVFHWRPTPAPKEHGQEDKTA